VEREKKIFIVRSLQGHMVGKGSKHRAVFNL
ncbi:hypothetical protein DBR06_SOUSAS6310078, partial [Sousa chinensis]